MLSQLAVFFQIYVYIMEVKLFISKLKKLSCKREVALVNSSFNYLCMIYYILIRKYPRFDTTVSCLEYSNLGN